MGESDEREGTVKKIKRFRSMRKVATMRGSGAQQAMRGYPRVQKKARGGWMISVLAQRAASEGPRWTRAVRIIQAP
jgi:hypothetical protein